MENNGNTSKFEELKQKTKRTDSMGAVLCYVFTESELTALLAAYEESKWKKLPENVPEINKDYLVQHEDGEIFKAWHNGLQWYKSATGSSYSKIAFFQELPEPFNRKEE